jgi:hypothetical protein
MQPYRSNGSLVVTQASENLHGADTPVPLGAAGDLGRLHSRVKRPQGVMRPALRPGTIRARRRQAYEKRQWTYSAAGSTRV